MGVVTIASLSFCFGRAGGIFGQRRLYKSGVTLYAVGAGLGAISTSFRQLLLARAIMAIGLAMALPMSTAILAASSIPSDAAKSLDCSRQRSLWDGPPVQPSPASCWSSAAGDGFSG